MAGFFARLVASSVAPFGYGTDLWSRRDQRWRHRRVNRLFAGFFATLIAYALLSLRGSHGRRLALRRDRMGALLRGYHRALIHWALEPYRFAWAWELGEGDWTRGRLTRVLAQCFMIPFAWATAGQHRAIGWRRFASRRLIGGLSMTMVACTALAFGSGPSFNDSRDESLATRLMASYGAGGSDNAPQGEASEEGGNASGGAGGGDGAGSETAQNGTGAPAGDPSLPTDPADDFSFDSPPSGDSGNGLMTLANFTPPGATDPEIPTPDAFDPATAPDSPTPPGGGGIGDLGGAGGGGGSSSGGGFAGGGSGTGGGAGGSGGNGGDAGGAPTPPTGGDTVPPLAGDLPVINPPPGEDFGTPPQDDRGVPTPTLATPLIDIDDNSGDPPVCLIDCDVPRGPLDEPQPPTFVEQPGAVPEPATWAMMVLGFGSLGAILRRQRRLGRMTLA